MDVHIMSSHVFEHVFEGETEIMGVHAFQAFLQAFLSILTNEWVSITDLIDLMI